MCVLYKGDTRFLSGEEEYCSLIQRTKPAAHALLRGWSIGLFYSVKFHEYSNMVTSCVGNILTCTRGTGGSATLIQLTPFR